MGTMNEPLDSPRAMQQFGEGTEHHYAQGQDVRMQHGYGGENSTRGWMGIGMTNAMPNHDVRMSPPPKDGEYETYFNPDAMDEYNGSDIDADGEIDPDIFGPASPSPPPASNNSDYPPLQPNVPAVPQSLSSHKPSLQSQRPNTPDATISDVAYAPTTTAPATQGGSSWKGYPETQGVMVDPRDIIQSRMNGHQGGSGIGQSSAGVAAANEGMRASGSGSGNAVASSSRLPITPQGSMTISPSQLQTAKPKPSVSKPSATNGVSSRGKPEAATTSKSQVLGPVPAAPPASSTSTTSVKATAKMPTKPARLTGSLAVNPLVPDVKALLHRDRLADTTKSSLPKLVSLLGERKTELGGKVQPRLYLGPQDMLEMMENMRMAPKRFQKDFAGNEAALEMSLLLFGQCISGMNQGGADELSWAKASYAAMSFEKTIGLYLMPDHIRRIVPVLMQLSPSQLSDRVDSDYKDKLQALRKELRALLKRRVTDVVEGKVAAVEIGKAEPPAKKRKAEELSKSDPVKKIKKEVSPPRSSRVSAAAGSSKTTTTSAPKRTGADMSAFGLTIPKPARPAPHAKTASKAEPDFLAALFQQAKQNGPVNSIAAYEEEDASSEAGQERVPKVIKMGKNNRPQKRVRWKPERELVAIREIERRDQSLVDEHDGHAKDLDHEGRAMKQLQEDRPWRKPAYLEYAGGGPEDASQDQHLEALEREKRTLPANYYSDSEVPPSPGGEPNVPSSTITANTMLYLDARRIVRENPNGLSHEEMDGDFEARYEPKIGLMVPQAVPDGLPPHAVMSAVPDNAQLAGLLSLIGTRTATGPPAPAAPVQAPSPAPAAPVFDISLLQSLGTTLGAGSPQQDPMPYQSQQYPAFQPQGPPLATFGVKPQQHGSSWNTQQAPPMGEANTGWGRSNGTLAMPQFPGPNQGQRRNGGGNGGNGDYVKGTCRFEKQQGYCVKDNCQWIHQNPKPGQR